MAPVLFLAHGAPPLLDDRVWFGELRAWASRLPRPSAILMISAHWEARPPMLGATRTVPLVYDYYGFPDRYYDVTYPAPGAPKLAARVRGLLPTVDDPNRGLDHGAFIPLMAMYPEADVPVLQMSMPSLDPRELFAMGKALAPLRGDGVLIVGSGFLTHNLRTFGTPGVPAWARDFDQWTAETLSERDLDALVAFREKAPAVGLAHPRTEHFAPVLVAAGATAGETPTFPINGWWMDMPFTKRSVQWG